VQDLDPDQFEGDPTGQWLYQQLLPFAATCAASSEAEVATGQLVGRRVAFVLMDSMHVQVGGLGCGLGLALMPVSPYRLALLCSLC
jgi:hypothetical protein